MTQGAMWSIPSAPPAPRSRQPAAGPSQCSNPHLRCRAQCGRPRSPTASKHDEASTATLRASHLGPCARSVAGLTPPGPGVPPQLRCPTSTPTVPQVAWLELAVAGAAPELAPTWRQAVPGAVLGFRPLGLTLGVSFKPNMTYQYKL